VGLSLGCPKVDKDYKKGEDNHSEDVLDEFFMGIL
jgi:hypothetical protein